MVTKVTESQAHFTSGVGRPWPAAVVVPKKKKKKKKKKVIEKESIQHKFTRFALRSWSVQLDYEGRCALLGIETHWSSGTATLRGCLSRDFLTIGSTRPRFFRGSTCMSRRDRSELDHYLTWRNAALALAPLIRLFVCAVSLMLFVIVINLTCRVPHC